MKNDVTTQFYLSRGLTGDSFNFTSHLESYLKQSVSLTISGQNILQEFLNKSFAYAARMPLWVTSWRYKENSTKGGVCGPLPPDYAKLN